MWFKLSRTIPVTPWRASSTWSLSPTRFAILFTGLALFGIGDGLLVVAQLGNTPWTVLAQGLSLRSDIPLGWWTLIISTVVLLFWIPLKEKPGFGTIANILLIALFIQLTVDQFDLPSIFWQQITVTVFGILLVGAGSSLYISCGLGAGPRDGLMTAIHYRTGVRVGRVRLLIEVSVLTLGWALGGRVGLGTFLFALCIGTSIAFWLGIVARLTQKKPSTQVG